MLKLTRWSGPKVVRMVDGGRVACPVVGRDLDVDVCLTCTHLTDVSPEGERQVAEIVCRPPVNRLAGMSFHGA